jgi:ABC-type branched-subunit amino acid transport system substrate-binding protein
MPVYKIGYVQDISSAYGAFGRLAQNGFKAGIDYVNTLGIANFQLEVRDDGGDPTRGANLARQLAQSGVKAIYGGSATVTAMLPVSNQYKILLADAGGLTAVLPKAGTSRQYPWVFCPDTACGSSTVLPEIEFLTKVDPTGVIGELSVNTAYGSGTTKYVASLLPQQFPNVKVTRQSFPSGTASVVAQLTKLQQAGATSLLAWTYGPDLVTVMHSLDRMGWYPYVVGPLGVGDPSVVSAIPSKLKGKVIAGGIATAQVGTAPGAVATGLNKTYFDLYNKYAGENTYNGLSTVGSYTFDWAVILAAAIKGSGSTDSTKMRDWLTAGHPIDTAEGVQMFGPDVDQRVGPKLSTTTVFDPQYPCTQGVCVAPKTG